VRKSDQKKRDRKVKNAEKQHKHQAQVRSALIRRDAKQRHYYDKMVNRVRREAATETEDEAIKKQLAHNLEILEALEKEYDQEQEAKKKLNVDLEGQGFSTLEEKMEYLQQIAVDEQKLEAMGVGGSADVELRVNTEENAS
jgi:hypothetical protein